jgi:aspartate kinase
MIDFAGPLRYNNLYGARGASFFMEGEGMGIKVAKFGGSSLSDARQFEKVRAIVYDDPERVYIVPSAPGRRYDGDDKVTDLLYRCQRLHAQGNDYQDVYDLIAARYMDIAEELGLRADLRGELDEINDAIMNGATADYAASRGEYLNGLLLADYLDMEFIDASQVIFFKADGTFDSEKTQEVLSARLKESKRAVIPGFYGASPDGRIRTFSRGGSDISGAIVARAACAEVYENWTDVSGFLMADPRIVPGARQIESITYQELRELSYMGATVLHEDSVFPVHRAGIPTNIRNTNCPGHPGTFIRFGTVEKENPYVITGIAGKKGFSIIAVEKAMMNTEVGFARRVLQAMEEQHLSFEHMPTGIDTLCVVVNKEALSACRDAVINRIIELAEPDTITINESMAVIATVGRGMVHNCGTAARLFGAMSRDGINVRMIDQGSSELSIIVGVDDADFEQTIRAIYNEFVHD